MMENLFGTDGIRGRVILDDCNDEEALQRIVEERELTPQLMRLLGESLGRTLPEDGNGDTIVIGWDERPDNLTLASWLTLGFHASNCTVIHIGLASTPMLHYAVLETGARLGCMITASHNPAEDSGYKVYWDDGAQIANPVDTKIAQRIDFKNPPTEESLADYEDATILKGDDELIKTYVDFASSSVSSESKREIKQIYTPLHGVGKKVFLDVFEKAGFENPTVVESQAEPDPDFPTVSFPNPEEEGALDLALGLAIEKNADLVIANDPDADRLAIVARHGNKWRHLNGNEIGVLLAEHILSKEQGEDRLVVTTVVSSRLLSKIADFHKVKYAETLTGFKWIVRPGIEDKSSRFVFGYEEALGFALGDSVRDKDGITSALVFAYFIQKPTELDAILIESPLFLYILPIKIKK